MKFVFMHSVKAASSDKTLMTDQKFKHKGPWKSGLTCHTAAAGPLESVPTLQQPQGFTYETYVTKTVALFRSSSLLRRL